MNFQKKSYEVLSDAQDQENFLTLKRILNYLWIPLSTIGFTGIGPVIREIIDGLDRWGERGCATAQVMELFAQFEQDVNSARTQAMSTRSDYSEGSRMPHFRESSEFNDST